MKQETHGWVIENIGHPSSGNKFIVLNTFRFTRKEAIAKFISGSDYTWEYWKRKFNYRAVKAKQTIQT